MKTSQELKQQARVALRGNWGWGVGVSLVPLVALMICSLFLLAVINMVMIQATGDTFTVGTNIVLIFLTMALLSVGLFTFFGVIGINAGAQFAYLDLIRGRKRSIKEAASYPFKEERFDSIFGVWLMGTLICLIASVFLLVPGIILGISFSQAYFILRDDFEQGRGVSLMSALKKSRMRMDGHKMAYFKLVLSFIGWYFLVGLVAGALNALIANLLPLDSTPYIVLNISLNFLSGLLSTAFLTPYIGTTLAAFYQDLLAQEEPKGLAEYEEELAKKKADYQASLDEYNAKVKERREKKKSAYDAKMADKLDAKEAREAKRREKAAEKAQAKAEKRAKNPKAVARDEKKAKRREKAIAKLEAKEAKYAKAKPASEGKSDQDKPSDDKAKTESAQQTKSAAANRQGMSTKKSHPHKSNKKKGKKKAKKRK